MIGTTLKIATSAVGATLAGMLFVGVFVGALHQPAPRQVPVGMAGPAAAARQVEADLARHSPGAFTVTAYPDAAAARQAIDDRDVDAALVPGLGGPRLLVAGAAGPFATQAVTGALPGNPAGLIGIVALTAFAVSTAYTAAYRLAGLPLAVALLLLFVPVGISAAGGVLGPAFITSWYAQLGSGLPASAAMPAIRDVVSFGGHALAGPLLVLCLWAGVSAVVLALPRPRIALGNARHPGERRPDRNTDARAVRKLEPLYRTDRGARAGRMARAVSATAGRQRQPPAMHR